MHILEHFIGGISYKWHLLVGFFIRTILIFYSDFIDSISEVPYTDIDYYVFTDAARHIYNGRSPYERHTYRYSPLLGIILLPNIVINHNFGKFLFSIVDIIVGLLIQKLVSEYLKKTNLKLCGVKKSTHSICFYANLSMCIWLYNPLSIIISTRGSCDSLATFFVLSTLYFIYIEKNYLLSGIFHGLACHFRLYPIVYSLALFMHLSEYNVTYFKNDTNTTNQLQKYQQSELVALNNKDTKRRTIFQKRFLYYLIPNKRQIIFIISTVVTFSILLITFYFLYGYKFLFETYIYHILRKDTRHNFSIYFYLQYLTADIKNLGIWHKVLTTLPNLILLIVISIRYGLHHHCLFFSILLQTLVLISYNTVLTAQYFIWFLALLPLVVWHLQLNTFQWFKLATIWAIGQLAWLLPAYLLEFQGQNTFLFVWLQSVAFFSANIIIMSRFIKYFTPIIVVKSD